MEMAADNLECYENLANAIILQAVKDYKTVLFRLEDHPNNRDAQFEKKRLEGFFHSNWYNTLTDLDACTLISGVQARVKVEAVHGGQAAKIDAQLTDIQDRLFVLIAVSQEAAGGHTV